MKVDLKTYVETRDRIRAAQYVPGPVVTISRMFGCEATPLALMLINRISESSTAPGHHGWQMISKEILDEAAHELHVSRSKIETVLDAKQVSGFGHMLLSLNTHYDISDRKVLDTLREVLYVYAVRGKTIIIGRGGAYLTRNIRRSLHIKLQAPLSWRVNKILNKRNLAHKEALELVRAMDEKRNLWIEHMTGRPASDDSYDLILNRATMSDEMILETILQVMKEKHLMEQHPAESGYVRATP